MRYESLELPVPNRKKKLVVWRRRRRRKSRSEDPQFHLQGPWVKKRSRMIRMYVG